MLLYRLIKWRKALFSLFIFKIWKLQETHVVTTCYGPCGISTWQLKRIGITTTLSIVLWQLRIRYWFYKGQLNEQKMRLQTSKIVIYIWQKGRWPKIWWGRFNELPSEMLSEFWKNWITEVKSFIIWRSLIKEDSWMWVFLKMNWIDTIEYIYWCGKSTRPQNLF